MELARENAEDTEIFYLFSVSSEYFIAQDLAVKKSLLFGKT